MKNKKIWMLGISLASLLMLGGCGEKGKAASDDTDDKGPTKITWMNILHTASPPTDVIVDKLEKNTNTEITFNWIPDASKEERITTALASDELADIVTITTLGNSSVRNAFKTGMFWDVKDYLKDYPNLKNISEDRIKAASIEGKLYGVPFQKNLARGGLVIRQDWLDKLGLKVPTTTEELFEVARQFTENDPDGNGKKDTTGFGDRAPTDIRYTSFKLFTSYFGAPNGWGVNKSGKFTPEFETKEYKEALDYSRELYKKGYLAQDFAVTQKTDQQQQFAQGKTGIYAGMIDIANLEKMGKGIQPGMKLVPVNKISDGSGEYHVWSEGSGVGGVLAFPKSQVKSEKELRKMLQFVNDLIDEDNYMLMTGGIEGTHYSMDNGAIKYIDTDLWQKDVQPLSSSRPSEVTYSLKDANPTKQLANDLVKENEKYAVLDPTVPLDSATNNEIGTELQKIMTDAVVKYIMGQIDDKGYEEAIKNWESQGGSKITKEYEEAYKKAK